MEKGKGFSVKSQARITEKTMKGLLLGKSQTILTEIAKLISESKNGLEGENVI